MNSQILSTAITAVTATTGANNKAEKPETGTCIFLLFGAATASDFQSTQIENYQQYFPRSEIQMETKTRIRIIRVV